MVGHNVSVKVTSEGDDWETDPDFEVGGNVLSAPISIVCYATLCISAFCAVNIRYDLYEL